LVLATILRPRAATRRRNTFFVQFSNIHSLTQLLLLALMGSFNLEFGLKVCSVF
jgi:hypothetical protein